MTHWIGWVLLCAGVLLIALGAWRGLDQRWHELPADCDPGSVPIWGPTEQWTCSPFDGSDSLCWDEELELWSWCSL